MLASGGQGIMRLMVTYGVSRITCVARFCRVRHSLFHAVNRTVVLLFLPPLPFLLGGFGKYSVGISIDFVRVRVSGGWLPWMPVCPAQGLWLKARCSPWNRRPLQQAPSPSSHL